MKNNPPFKNKILLNRSRSVHPSQTRHFTSIMVLYDNIVTLLVEKNIPGFGFVPGLEKATFLHIRAKQDKLDA